MVEHNEDLRSLLAWPGGNGLNATQKQPWNTRDLWVDVGGYTT